jgi:hypothetical protein
LPTNFGDEFWQQILATNFGNKFWRRILATFVLLDFFELFLRDHTD